MNDKTPVKFVDITETQYLALTTKDPGTVYFVHGSSGNRLYVGNSEWCYNVVDYDDLTDKPSINGVTLSGSKTSDDLKLQDKMVVLSYGHSTWAEFDLDYHENAVVYCRASSNSDPATGSQTRLAFMAYVNSGDNPTEVEFQYYRSVATHSATQQGDQVYVYKLNKTNGWSVTVREACIKIAAGGDITQSFANNTLTLSATAQSLGAVSTSDVGVADGVAELDSNGKVPTSQLPSYVDDVLEYNSLSDFPSEGETGKIYIALDTNITYRWSGSAYVEISPSLALGETSSTAYRGDRGAAAYAHSVTNKGSAFSSGMYKITTNSEGHVTAATSVAKSDITGLGIQEELTSGTNIKTINNQSILGSGNLSISGGVSDVTVDGTSVVSGGVAAIDLSDYVAEDSNGDITITRDVIASRDVQADGSISSNTGISTAGTILSEGGITDSDGTNTVDISSGGIITTGDVSVGGDLTAGGDVEDGSGNILSDKADLADIPGEATSSTTGTIKLNPNESIDLNASGQLTVGGRLGQFTNGGLYYPTSSDPTNVGNYSLLISEGKGLSTAHRAFIVAGGTNVTLKTTAAAGATQYVVSNTSNNRFACSSFRGGRLAVSEAEAKNKTVEILSVQFQNGGDVIPYSGGTDSSNNIIITVDESLNPSGTLSSVRGYGTWTASDTISSGQGNRSTGGKTLQVGQSLTNDGGNQVLMVGNRLYNTSNSSTLFGYDHINKVQQAFMSGQGHDSTNGVKGVTAFGTWSVIDSSTMFVIGDGSSSSARHNVFEIDTNGDTKVTHDLTVGEHITATGNITDGSGNVLANKLDAGDVPDALTYYGVCTQSGTGRTVVLDQTGYETFTLTRGVLLSVKFSYAITSSTTISVDSEKSPDSVRINYMGSALSQSGIITAGDIALLQYDGTYWEVITVNRRNVLKVGSSGDILQNRGLYVGTQEFSSDNISITQTGTDSAHTIDVSKTGCTPISISGFKIENATSSGSGGGLCSMNQMYISGNTLNFRLLNRGTSAVKVKVTFDVLYVYN